MDIVDHTHVLQIGTASMSQATKLTDSLTVPLWIITLSFELRAMQLWSPAKIEFDNHPPLKQHGKSS